MTMTQRVYYLLQQFGPLRSLVSPPGAGGQRQMSSQVLPLLHQLRLAALFCSEGIDPSAWDEWVKLSANISQTIIVLLT